MAHPRPLAVRGEGIWLYDDTGKAYLDGSGGPLVVNVGHGRREIAAAMAEQAQALAYGHALMFSSPVMEAYAEAIAQTLPLPYARIYPLSSGTEAVEAALKLARQIQVARGEGQRELIIGRNQSYHGLSLGTLAISGRPAMRTPYLGMLRDMPHINPPYPYRDPVSGREAADRLEALLCDIGPQHVAAFIAEPISGASLGAVVPDDAYWPRIRAICDQYGVLLIADEVLVGMGRTGLWWAIERWQVQPDLLVASKGTAGGYMPHGFVAARHDDVEQVRVALGDFNHGGTFSHHPVGAAAALETLRIIQREKLVDNAATTGAYLQERLVAALGDHPRVGQIRGCGLFYGIELVADRATRVPFPIGDSIAWKLFLAAQEHGLVIYWSQGCADGLNGDIVLVGPPLIITPEQVDELVRRLQAAFESVFG
jgi:adenosylmethionine-8-amino-7-oxononanoate aminotransferase